MKKTDSKLALLRDFLKTRPIGMRARAALLALAFARGVPFLMLEAEPLKWRDRVIIGERKSYPNVEIPEHVRLLAECIATTASEIGRLDLDPKQIQDWIAMPHTAKVYERATRVFEKVARRNKARHDQSLRIRFNFGRYGWWHDRELRESLRYVRVAKGLSHQSAARLLLAEETALGMAPRPVHMLAAWIEDLERDRNSAAVEPATLMAIMAAYGIDDTVYAETLQRLDGKRPVPTREQVKKWHESRFTVNAAVGYNPESDKRYDTFGKAPDVRAPWDGEQRSMSWDNYTRVLRHDLGLSTLSHALQAAAESEDASSKGYNPDTTYPPGDHILEELEARGQTRVWLAAQLNVDDGFLEALLKGETEITPAVADGLERAFHAPASLWLNLERNHRETLRRLALQGEIKAVLPPSVKIESVSLTKDGTS